MSELYQQCVLSKRNVTTFSWVPVKNIKRGAILKIKENNEWSEGWKIVQAYGTKITEEKLNMLQRQHKDTRKVSDI